MGKEALCTGHVIDTRLNFAVRGIFQRKETWLLAEYDQFVGAFKLEKGYLVKKDDPEGQWYAVDHLPVGSDCAIWMRLYPDPLASLK